MCLWFTVNVEVNEVKMDALHSSRILCQLGHMLPKEKYKYSTTKIERMILILFGFPAIFWLWAYLIKGVCWLLFQWARTIKIKAVITKISSSKFIYSHDKLCSLGVKQQPLTYMFYILSQFIARFNLFFLRFLYALLNCSDRVVFFAFHLIKIGAIMATFLNGVSEWVFVVSTIFQLYYSGTS